MKILGLDTSTPVGSIGITDDESVVAEYSLNVVETHSSRLMPAIDEVLRSASLAIHDMDAFAVALGPGSFTGLRIGLGTIKGFCYALKKPIVGVVTLDALAYNLKFVDKLVCPILDARRGEVYAAVYRGSPDGKLELQTDYLCTKIEPLLETLTEPTVFLGDGLNRYKETIAEILKNKAILTPPFFGFCRGVAVALLGYERLKAGESDDYFSITPFYIRKSEAEVNFEAGRLQSC